MSNFDLKLDRWNKIATILIGVLGILFTLYIFFYFDKNRIQMEEAKTCLDWMEKEKNAGNKLSQPQLEKLLTALTKHCSDDENSNTVSSYINQVFALKQENKTLQDENVSLTTANNELKTKLNQAVQVKEEPNKGSVSLGLKSDYQTSNFRNLKTDEKALKYLNDLKKGTVLKARWSVNLRDNKSNTEEGNNPSIAIIHDNECVKMEEDLPKDALRGSFWVKVSLSDCKVSD